MSHYPKQWNNAMPSMARPMVRQNVVVNVLICFTSLVVTAIVSEVAFRTLLFSNISFMKRFRNAALYADYFSDNDYWKLYCIFSDKDCEADINPDPHPLLGWTGDFSRDSYLHKDFGRVGHRRPVLLYGDSFAGCITLAGKQREGCFEAILNSDKVFAREHFLLNYGVGAYGVDQIYLLFKNSIHYYRNPFVIVSLMTWDLDRSIMTNRTGVKPFFDVINGELVLHGPPVDPDHARIAVESPPQIISYLYRLWLYQDGRPWRFRQYLRDVEGTRKKVVMVNKQILQSIVNELKERQIDYIFLIFHPLSSFGRDDWRDRFLVQWMTDNKIPYMSTREIIGNDARQWNRPISEYYIPGDGHQNAYQNLAIAHEMKRVILPQGS
jgi:hypothetical protein